MGIWSAKTPSIGGCRRSHVRHAEGLEPRRMSALGNIHDGALERNEAGGIPVAVRVAVDGLLGDARLKGERRRGPLRRGPLPAKNGRSVAGRSVMFHPSRRRRRPNYVLCDCFFARIDVLFAFHHKTVRVADIVECRTGAHRSVPAPAG